MWIFLFFLPISNQLNFQAKHFFKDGLVCLTLSSVSDSDLFKFQRKKNAFYNMIIPDY